MIRFKSRMLASTVQLPRIAIAVFFIFIISIELSAQTPPGTTEKSEAKPKPLSGLKWTGLPLVSFNTDDGFGYGLRAIGTYFDPEYAPYKMQLWAQYYKTTKKLEYHEFKIDLLDLFGSDLRFQFRGGYVRNQSAQYYGYSNFQDIKRNRKIREGRIPTNENLPQMPDLMQLDLGNIGPLGREDYALNVYGGVNRGRRFLRERQNKFFKYDRVEPYLFVGVEEWFGKSNFKWYTGLKTTRYSIDTYRGDKDDGEAEPNGLTKLDIDKPIGYDAIDNARFVNQIRAALVYDSRPRLREKNPNTGIFADVHGTVVSKSTGSDYDFQRLGLTYRQYIEILEKLFHPWNQEFVFAYRLQAQKTFGDAPFFEMNRIISKYEEAEGLGGSYGLRGYPSNQFVDRVMTIGNFELRYTFSKTSWMGGMDWILISYYDVGRVAAYIKDLDFLGWHKAVGGGLRLVWQKNTVVNISSGISRYESYTTFNFDHMF